jgi:hypothetical protein
LAGGVKELEAAGARMDIEVFDTIKRSEGGVIYAGWYSTRTRYERKKPGLLRHWDRPVKMNYYANYHDI